jgi:hypothetical protein
LTYKICPECGHKKAPENPSSGSNATREVNMTIPEKHWPIFKMLFAQMNVKFGMQGLGEFANILPEYSKQIPLDFEKFRYFDDASIAYAFLSFERGYRIETLIEDGGQPDFAGNPRVKVYAELTHPDFEKSLHLTLSDGAPRQNAEDFCAYIKDASERFTAKL